MALELAFDSIGDGPPLIVLHGLFGSHTRWRTIARALSATHRFIGVKLCHHGGSMSAFARGMRSVDLFTTAGPAAPSRPAA